MRWFGRSAITRWRVASNEKRTVAWGVYESRRRGQGVRRERNVVCNGTDGEDGGGEGVERGWERVRERARVARKREYGLGYLRMRFLYK